MNYESVFEKNKKNWYNFKSNENNKKIRIRDAAKIFKTSEANLLSTQTNDNVFFLKLDLEYFFHVIKTIDKLMFLTRNDIMVHELILSGDQIIFAEDRILFHENNLPILSINKDDIKFSFFETSYHGKKKLHSLQLFDTEGEAVLKIYLKGKDQVKFLKIKSKQKVDYNFEVQKINVKNYIKMKNDFDIFYDFSEDANVRFDVIKHSKLILRDLLENFSKEKLPIQIHGFGNNTLQYFFGKIKNIVDFGPWINIIDKKFNLHVLEDKIKYSQINRFSHGKINYVSVEFFDKSNNTVLGISSLKDHQKKFQQIIDKIGVSYNA